MTYFDRQHTGGASASGGFNFQDYHCATSVIHALHDVAFLGVMCEGDEDTILQFQDSQVRIQAKSRPIRQAELQGILNRFASHMSTFSQGQRVAYYLALGTEPDEAVRRVAKYLGQLQEALSAGYHSSELQTIQDDFVKAMETMSVAFSIDLAARTTIDVTPAMIDPDAAEAVFCRSVLMEGTLMTDYPAARAVFSAWLQRFAAARQQRGFVTVEVLIEGIVRSSGVTPARVYKALYNESKPVTDRVQWEPQKGLIRGELIMVNPGSRIAIRDVPVYAQGQILQNNYSAVTLGDGTFEFLDLPPDIYQLHAEIHITSRAIGAFGSGLASIAIGAEAKNVVVEAGGSVFESLRVAESGGLFGQVTDAVSSEPIRGANIRVGSTGGWTNEGGTYQISFCQVGWHLVEISAPGYERKHEYLSVPGLLPNQGESRANFTLQPTQAGDATICGIATEGIAPRHVSAESATGARVELLAEDGEVLQEFVVFQEGPPRPTGNYVFQGLKIGRYDVRVTKEGMQPASTRVDIHKNGVTWAPDLHVRPLRLLEPPTVDRVWIDGSERVRTGDRLSFRVLVNRSVWTVGLEIQGQGVGQSFQLEALDASNTLWGLEYPANMAGGTYAIIDAQVNDTDRRYYLVRCRVPFVVEGE